MCVLVYICMCTYTAVFVLRERREVVWTLKSLLTLNHYQCWSSPSSSSLVCCCPCCCVIAVICHWEKEKMREKVNGTKAENHHSHCVSEIFTMSHQMSAVVIGAAVAIVQVVQGMETLDFLCNLCRKFLTLSWFVALFWFWLFEPSQIHLAEPSWAFKCKRWER